MKTGGGSGDLFADDEAPTNTPADNRLREPLTDVFARVAPAWKPVTDAFLATPEGQSLAHYVDARVADGAVVYPGHVFRALDLTAPQDARVVIVGQDPYHGPGQAQGLAFSVGDGQKLPPSLRNMLKEVQADTGTPSQCRGDLSAWAQQGVLLLNTSLTVEDGQPQSHAGRGWESLTDALLAHVACGMQPVVFLLWGASAQPKRASLNKPPHPVHPASNPPHESTFHPPEPYIGLH